MSEPVRDLSALVPPSEPEPAKRGRGRPPGSKTRPAVPEIVPDAPPPFDAAAWESFAPVALPFLVPFYVRYRVPPPTVETVAPVCVAWGRVFNKYSPTLGGYTEEITAVLLTLGLVAPVLQAMQTERRAAPVTPPAPPSSPSDDTASVHADTLPA